MNRWLFFLVCWCSWRGAAIDFHIVKRFSLFFFSSFLLCFVRRQFSRLFVCKCKWVSACACMCLPPRDWLCVGVCFGNCWLQLQLQLSQSLFLSHCLPSLLHRQINIKRLSSAEEAVAETETKTAVFLFVLSASSKVHWTSLVNRFSRTISINISSRTNLWTRPLIWATRRQLIQCWGYDHQKRQNFHHHQQQTNCTHDSGYFLVSSSSKFS